ncbi:MAG: metal ABC transporter substrate-binding protein [Candidatus Parcubacteria bacterium]|nr:MAG: metal ABC transporter substrate-binding protein [Candidatus Parcubacteria bacterium]
MLDFKKKLFFVLLVLSIFLFFLSFINFQSIKKNKLNIVVTNGAVYDFVRNIANDKVNIIRLDYYNDLSKNKKISLSLNDLEKLNSANLILKIGFDFDNWLDDNFKGRYYYLYNKVFLIKDEDEANPYYWLSIKNAQIIIRDINQILKSYDPNNSFYYDKKTYDYLLKLKELEEYANNNLNNLKNKKLVIITHPSLKYLLKDYEIKTIEIDKLNEIKASEVLKLVKLIKDNQIKVIFSEKNLIFNDFLVQIINLYDLKLYFLDSIISIDPETSYYNLMKENFDKIKEALSENN